MQGAKRSVQLGVFAGLILLALGIAVSGVGGAAPAGPAAQASFARLCAQCHGQNGGGGPGGPLDAKGHAYLHTNVYLARVITKGNGFPDPRTYMPGFGDQLSDQAVAAVVAYLKTLWTPEQRAQQEQLNRR